MPVQKKQFLLLLASVLAVVAHGQVVHNLASGSSTPFDGLVVDASNTLLIQTDPTSPEDAPPASVTCGDTDPAFLLQNAALLTLSNVVVTNCTGTFAVLYDTAQLSLQNVVVIDNFGTFIQLFDSAAVSTLGSTFANNEQVFQAWNSSFIDIASSEFTFNGALVADTYGGVAQLFNQSSFSATASSFTGNAAYYGGVVWGSGSTNVTLADSTFVKNDAWGGGGVVARDADMLRQEIVFDQNPSVQWSEIYIVVSETFSLTVTGCNFTQNGLSIKSTAVTGTSLTNGGGCFAVSNTTGAIAIHNSNFNANQVGSGANGGVFLCYQCRGPITITSSAFSSNSAGGQGGALNLYYTNSAVLVQDCTFTGSTSYLEGGSISYSYSTGNTSFVNCVFSNNSAAVGNSSPQSGGAMYILGPSNVTAQFTIDGCLFSNHVNFGSGPAIYLTSSGVNKPFLYMVPNSHFVVRNSVFSFNQMTSQSGYGGAVAIDVHYFNGNFGVLLTNDTFDNNYSSENGGAVYLNSLIYCLASCTSYSVAFDNSNFINNFAGTNGGALSVQSLPSESLATFEPSVQVSNTFFLNNSAASLGGAFHRVCLLPICSDIFNDCIFNSNNAGAEGHALYVDGSATAAFLSNIPLVQISSTEFGMHANIASVIRVLDVQLNLQAISFANNSAQIISASASLPFAWTGNSQLLASCNFTGNSQVLLDLQDVDVNVQNVQIAENVADAELVNLGGTSILQMNGVGFVGNSVDSILNCDTSALSVNFDNVQVSNNAILGSSALLVTSGCRLSIENSVFANNAGSSSIISAETTGQISIDGSYFSGNQVTVATISLADDSVVTISGSTFDSDGAIVISGDALLDVTMLTMSGYTSTALKVNGGTVQATGLVVSNSYSPMIITAGNVSISTSQFANCTSQSSGGALSVLGGNLALLDVAFENNSAAVGAGAININMAKGSSFDMQGGSFVNNSATIFGGAIAISRSSNASLNGTVFWGNQVTEVYGCGGSVYLTSAASLLLNDITGAMSSSGGEGGFACVQGSAQLAISASSLVGSQAGSFGGAIFTAQHAAIDVTGGTTITNSLSGADGGAVFTSGSAAVELSSATLANNSASGSGGAIAASASTSGTITIVNTVFVDNAALVNGGGISAPTSLLDCTDSSFTGNIASTGGAIWLSSNLSPVVDLLGTNTFADNIATSSASKNVYAMPAFFVVNSSADIDAFASGAALPDVTLQLIDSLGQPYLDPIGIVLQIVVNNSAVLQSPALVQPLVNGKVNFTDVVLLALPGNFVVQVTVVTAPLSLQAVTATAALQTSFQVVVTDCPTSQVYAVPDTASACVPVPTSTQPPSSPLTQPATQPMPMFCPQGCVSGQGECIGYNTCSCASGFVGLDCSLVDGDVDMIVVTATPANFTSSLQTLLGASLETVILWSNSANATYAIFDHDDDSYLTVERLDGILAEIQQSFPSVPATIVLAERTIIDMDSFVSIIAIAVSMGFFLLTAIMLITSVCWRPRQNAGAESSVSGSMLFFVKLIHCSALLAFGSIFLYIGEPNLAQCALQVVVGPVAFGLFMASIWNVLVDIDDEGGNTRVASKQHPTRQSLMVVFLAIAVELIISVIWIGSNMPQKVTFGSPGNYYWSCASESETVTTAFTIAFCVLNAIILGVVLARAFSMVGSPRLLVLIRWALSLLVVCAVAILAVIYSISSNLLIQFTVRSFGVIITTVVVGLITLIGSDVSSWIFGGNPAANFSIHSTTFKKGMVEISLDGIITQYGDEIGNVLNANPNLPNRPILTGELIMRSSAPSKYSWRRPRWQHVVGQLMKGQNDDLGGGVMILIPVVQSPASMTHAVFLKDAKVIRFLRTSMPNDFHLMITTEDNQLFEIDAPSYAASADMVQWESLIKQVAAPGSSITRVSQERPVAALDRNASQATSPVSVLNANSSPMGTLQDTPHGSPTMSMPPSRLPMHHALN